MKSIILFIMLTCTVLADEALIEVASSNVIAVKPDGSIWSANETNGMFLVTQLIENEFTFPRDPAPVITFPYASYSNDYVVITQRLDALSVRIMAEPVVRTNVIRKLVDISEYKINPKANKHKKLKKGDKDFYKKPKKEKEKP